VRLLFMTFIVSLITFVGDLFILPRMNKAMALISDILGLFILYLILGNLFFNNNIPLVLPAFSATLFIGACEAFFHMYMMENIHEESRGRLSTGRLQIEASEEFKPDDKKIIKQVKRKE